MATKQASATTTLDVARLEGENTRNPLVIAVSSEPSTKA
jgi:hypothetical protein